MGDRFDEDARIDNQKMFKMLLATIVPDRIGQRNSG